MNINGRVQVSIMDMDLAELAPFDWIIFRPLSIFFVELEYGNGLLYIFVRH